MRRWMVLLLIIAVAAVVLGRLYLRSWRGREVLQVAVDEGRVVAAVYATGRVDTDQRATVRARVAAPLATLLVGPGEVVKRGQEVARQDVTALQLAVERSMREVEGSRANVAEAEDAAARSEKLAREALLPEDALVRARERARQLRADLAARESALTLAQEQATWVVLRAPVSGAVSALQHRAGDALREGDDVLTIVDLTSAYLRVAVDERDVGRIVIGQDVRMVFDAYPSKVLHGVVWRILPAVDRLTKSTDVLVQLPADRPNLQLDLTVTVNIVTEIIENALTLPRDALEGSGDRRQVYVVSGQSRVDTREVRLGSCDEERCQLLSGLTRGEKVVSPIPAGLKAGDKALVR